MTLNIRYQALLLILICLISCKKNEQSKPPPVTTSPPTQAKSIEIVSGNNQMGYAGRPLDDTIVIKVTLNSAIDTSGLSYYYRPGNFQDQFYIVSRTNINSVTYLKGIWSPAANAASPTITFYTYSGCSTTQINQGGCKTLDSVKVTATLRKPWVSVYTGVQNGLNVLYDLNFTDSNNGLAIGDWSGVVRTSNAGKTWTQGAAVRTDNDMQQLSFSGPDTGLVVLTNNYAYFTYDGGNTYTQQTWSPPFVGDRSSSAYYMQSRNVIYTVGWHGQIAKTTDGGANWTAEGFTFLNNFYDIVAKGKDTLYACGDVGKIVKTTDAGQTWHEQPIQLNDYLNTLFFVTNNFGFAGGQNGALIRTTNGGTNWSIIKTGLSFPIIAIRFFTSQHGFIVTNGGEIAESNDGGLTWVKRNTDNYGVNSLNKAVIKDETIIFGLQQAFIYTYDLTQK